ncbi:MAG: HYR domain-containing protein, partial [Acidobacteriota bacterium]
ASDNCPGATVACVPNTGSTFAVGTTTVTCTATDASNNTATCTFTVTVTDNQNPTITCPANQTAVSPGGPVAVTYPAPTATDNCPGVTTNCVPASGSTFALGTTTVTCTATDAANLTATCSFTVTVITCTSITCPADIFVGTTGNSSVVTYSLPVANGNCGTITCSPASGSTFNVGTTTVSCSSSIGNQTCAFNVTVNRVGGTVSDPLVCTGPGNTVQATLVISNNGNVNQTIADTTTFTNLVGVPNSCTVSPNVGTCTVTNGNLIYNGTLTPGQTVTITYLTQVSDLALAGAQVCTNNSVSFNGGNPFAFSVCDVVNCPVAGPGLPFPARAEASDQAAGSVLIYNIYTSSSSAPNTQNTRVSLTNVHPVLSANVHLFFVDGASCSIADSYVCLTGSQTSSFLMSDLDPGTTGYIVAVATDSLGCPINFNYLIGDEYVKFQSGHAANLGAQAFSAIPGGLVSCNQNSVTATINFDGVSYDRTPRTLALDSIGSKADGNDTLLVLNRIGGNLGTGAATLGAIFGIFYDDSENSVSFSVTGGCQLRSSISNNLPRITPRFEQFIPAGRTGWMRFFSQSDIGMTGSAINFNPNSTSSAGAFNQGHNLHTLTLSGAASYVIPVFPPSC